MCVVRLSSSSSHQLVSVPVAPSRSAAKRAFFSFFLFVWCRCQPPHHRRTSPGTRPLLPSPILVPAFFPFLQQTCHSILIVASAFLSSSVPSVLSPTSFFSVSVLHIAMSSLSLFLLVHPSQNREQCARSGSLGPWVQPTHQCLHCIPGERDSKGPLKGTTEIKERPSAAISISHSIPHYPSLRIPWSFPFRNVLLSEPGVKESQRDGRVVKETNTAVPCALFLALVVCFVSVAIVIQVFVRRTLVCFDVLFSLFSCPRCPPLLLDKSVLHAFPSTDMLLSLSSLPAAPRPD